MWCGVQLVLSASGYHTQSQWDGEGVSFEFRSLHGSVANSTYWYPQDQGGRDWVQRLIEFPIPPASSGVVSVRHCIMVRQRSFSPGDQTWQSQITLAVKSVPDGKSCDRALWYALLFRLFLRFIDYRSHSLSPALQVHARLARDSDR